MPKILYQIVVLAIALEASSSHNDSTASTNKLELLTANVTLFFQNIQV